MNHTDWVFILDPDEELTPVNFAASKQPDWCSRDQLPLISLIMEQMLATATRHMLRWYKEMIKYIKGNHVLESSVVCPLGMSLCPIQNKCRTIVGFVFPVYLWLRGPHAAVEAFPTQRSKLPAQYSTMLRSAPTDNRAEYWKAAYRTKYSPVLQGLSIHVNDIEPRKQFIILAPRQIHGGLSLELVHQRTDNPMKGNSSALLMSDYRLVQLADSYHQCMQRLGSL